MITKACKYCGIDQPLDNYYKSAGNRGGHIPKCKACRKLEYQANKSRISPARKERYYADQAKNQAYSRAWYQANKAKALEASRAWADRNKEKAREIKRQWAALNTGIAKASAAQRRAAVRQGTPPWLSESDKANIAGFYEMAARVSSCTGIKHHVDHYYPLRGKAVSGLHVPSNLRVIPAKLNLRKGNRHDL